MFDLKKQERSVLIFLAVALLAGLSLAAYKKYHRPADIVIGSFEPESRVIAARPKIDINTAGVDELKSLEGIGPAIAGRIAEYRQAHGTFASIEEIMNVKGIGQALFDKIKERITVGE